MNTSQIFIFYPEYGTATYLRTTEGKGCCVHAGAEVQAVQCYTSRGRNQMESFCPWGEGKREEMGAVPKKYHKYVTRRRNS